MVRMMVALMILVASAVPAKAQWGYPVQTVYDSGYTYTLYSSGNITRSSGWGQQLIDDGTGTRMIAAGHGSLYVLKNNGNIWMWRHERWQMIDNGTGTSEIWVDWGTVYCRKNNGQTWRCLDPYRMQWQPAGGGWHGLVRAQNFDKLHGK